MALHNSFLIRRNPEHGTLEMTNLENDRVVQLPYRSGSASYQGWEYLTDDNVYVTYMRYYLYNDEKDKGIEFWTTDSWKHIYTLKPNFYQTDFVGGSAGSYPGEIAISPDNTLFAIAFAGQVFIYDIRLITM